MSIETLISQVDPYTVAKIATGIVGAGFACAGVGHVVEKTGSAIKDFAGNNSTTSSVALRKFGSGMESSGRGLFLIGKYTAYTVVVPAYIATYEFPKWAVTKAIPKGFSLLNRMMIRPLFHGVEWMVCHVAKVVEVIFDNIILPIMKILVWKPLTFLVGRIVDLSVVICKRVLFPLIDQIEKLVFFCVINPLFRLSVWTFKAAVQVIQIADRFVFTPVFKLAKMIGSIALKVLIKPIFNTIHFVAKDCILPVISTIAKIVNKCLITPVIEIIKWTYQDLILPVASAAHAVMDFAYRYFIELPLRYVSQYILSPVIHLITASAKLVYQKLLVPIYEITARILDGISRPIVIAFDYMVKISFEIGKIYQRIKEDICAFLGIKISGKKFKERKIVRNPSFVHRAVIEPVKRIFSWIAALFSNLLSRLPKGQFFQRPDFSQGSGGPHQPLPRAEFCG